MNSLCTEYIKQNIPTFYHTVQVADMVVSTNDSLKQLAEKEREGYVLIADGQTAGKGRNGKSFFSEKGKGLYMSILLKPRCDIYHSLLVTAAAAAAAVQAVENRGPQCSIKWVNDIYIADKKVAGILCEAALKPNSPVLDYLILGIGINTHKSTKPAEIADIAAAVEDFAPAPDRNRLAADFLTAFYNYYSNFENREFMAIYNGKSNITGREITVHERGGSYTATATGIDDMGGLIIKTADGKEKTLVSAEISIRKNSL